MKTEDTEALVRQES